MKLIVGLGNPGSKYEKTRHNAGFMFLDYIAEKNKVVFTTNGSFSIETASLEHNITLIKPQLFMNSSGEVVAKYAHYYKIEPKDIVIIHDDLDIHLGEFKIAHAKGPKVHNGVNSVEEKLGTNDFLRVRLGVDNRTPENRIAGDTYVLSNFSDEELTMLKASFEKTHTDLWNNL